MGKYIFQNHPFKDEILKMFADGQNPYAVMQFLQNKGVDYILSKVTLYKHYKYFKNANKVQKAKTGDKESETFKGLLETELWNTIHQCNLFMQDKGLSPKDWQYFDQQKQSAIEKLIKLKDFKGNTEDASVMLSKFFQKFTLEKSLAEDQSVTEEKNEEAQGDDNKSGASSDLLPGESL